MSEGAPKHESAAMLTWKQGVELPPFSSSNVEVVSLLKALADLPCNSMPAFDIDVAGCHGQLVGDFEADPAAAWSI